MIYLLAIVIDLAFGIWGALGRPWYWYLISVALLISSSSIINTSYIQWLTRCYAVRRLRTSSAGLHIANLSFLTLFYFCFGYLISRYALGADHMKIGLFFVACITVSTFVAFNDNMFETAIRKTRSLMGIKSRNPETMIVFTLIGLTAFAWGAYGLYTSFSHGRTPVLSWQTSHAVVFGFIWLLFIFPNTLYQIRTLRNCFLSVAVWDHGLSGLPFAVVNMIVQISGILIIAIAWFPTPLPHPLDMIDGGIITGIIAFGAVIAVLASCNFALTKYMKWLFREQHAEYLRRIEAVENSDP
jgi:hypothetical protein